MLSALLWDGSHLSDYLYHWITHLGPEKNTKMYFRNTGEAPKSGLRAKLFLHSSVSLMCFVFVPCLDFIWWLCRLGLLILLPYSNWLIKWTFNLLSKEYSHTLWRCIPPFYINHYISHSTDWKWLFVTVTLMMVWLLVPNRLVWVLLKSLGIFTYNNP